MCFSATKYYRCFDTFLKIPDDFSITYDDVEGELVVGGVFLRLFIAQPSWVSLFNSSFIYSSCFLYKMLSIPFSVGLVTIYAEIEFPCLFFQVLRKPKDFMVAIMDKFVSLTTRPGSTVCWCYLVNLVISYTALGNCTWIINFKRRATIQNIFSSLFNSTFH